MGVLQLVSFSLSLSLGLSLPRKLPQKCDQLSCEHVSCVSRVSCTIGIICNRCICVPPHLPRKLPQKCDQLSCEYLSFHVYHVPYSYVTDGFSQICPGSCPKNVTNYRVSTYMSCMHIGIICNRCI